MKYLLQGSPDRTHAGLLIARVVLGVVFVAHGWQKLNDQTIEGVQAFFASQDVPMADLSAYAATYLELIGGIALIVGVAVPVVSLLFVLDMAGAYYFVHREAGFFSSDGGYEYVLMLGTASLLLVLAGAGRYSVDGWLLRTREKATAAYAA